MKIYFVPELGEEVEKWRGGEVEKWGGVYLLVPSKHG